MQSSVYIFANARARVTHYRRKAEEALRQATAKILHQQTINVALGKSNRELQAEANMFRAAEQAQR